MQNILIRYLIKYWGESFTTTDLANTFDYTNSEVNEMLSGCQQYGIERVQLGPGSFEYSCTTESVEKESMNYKLQTTSLEPTRRPQPQANSQRGRRRQETLRSRDIHRPPNYYDAWQQIDEPPPRAAALVPKVPSDQYFINLKQIFSSSRIMKIIIIDLNNVSNILPRLINEKDFQIHGFGNTEYKGLGSTFSPINNINYHFWCTKTHDQLEAHIPVVFALWAAHEAKVDMVKVYAKNRTIISIAKAFQYMIPCHTAYYIGDC